MTTAITYDMQKLDEAVSALSLAPGSIQERLRAAIGPLRQLKNTGLHRAALSAELDRILLGTSYENMSKLTDEHATAWALAIVELQSKNWHDTVWDIEQRILD